MLAMSYVEVGRSDEARVVFERQLAADLPDLPHDYAWLATTALTATVCAHLGDAARAEAIYRMMTPHSGGFVDLGPSWLSSVEHYLGLLAATMGHFEDADIHFFRAAGAEARIGAETWLARTRVAWAETLLDQRRSRDPERANGLLQQASDAAHDLGLDAISKRVAAAGYAPTVSRSR